MPLSRLPQPDAERQRSLGMKLLNPPVRGDGGFVHHVGRISMSVSYRRRPQFDITLRMPAIMFK
jgi:hypothetical protein